MSGLDALLAEPLGVCTKGLPDSLADVPLGGSASSGCRCGPATSCSPR